MRLLLLRNRACSSFDVVATQKDGNLREFFRQEVEKMFYAFTTPPESLTVSAVHPPRPGPCRPHQGRTAARHWLVWFAVSAVGQSSCQPRKLKKTTTTIKKTNTGKLCVVLIKTLLLLGVSSSESESKYTSLYMRELASPGSPSPPAPGSVGGPASGEVELTFFPPELAYSVSELPTS